MNKKVIPDANNHNAERIEGKDIIKEAQQE